ncbi:MAG: hypothetical protein GX061_04895 [Eubacteriaceae bacterium]|nr:hypothetical protein [Eubacteriaceae bacterium]
MCTSLISNRNKTIVGWNLDLLNMECKVTAQSERVYISVKTQEEGWLPLFGANNRGEFIAMPTCWPHDGRSDPSGEESTSIIMLDIELLLGRKTFEQVLIEAKAGRVHSEKGITYQAQLSDGKGNVLQIVPGQGYIYKEKPLYSVLINFSPFKGEREKHPWMGLDRYNKAVEMLEQADDDFDVRDCFEILKSTSQSVCPTVVSMVFDVTENTVYWCENQRWDNVVCKRMER